MASKASPLSPITSTLTASEAEENILKLMKGEERNQMVELKSEFNSNCREFKEKEKNIRWRFEHRRFFHPRKEKKKCWKCKRRLSKIKDKKYSLQTTVRVLRKRVTTLKSLLTYLRKQSYISEAAESTIRESVQGPAADLLTDLLKGPTKQKYKSLRSFALTLPHPVTISKWFKCIDGSPGFTKEALTALKIKQVQSDYPVLCNLVMDEMAIRKQVEWTGSKFTGYVDIRTNIDSDSLPMAREALVFISKKIISLLPYL